MRPFLRSAGVRIVAVAILFGACVSVIAYARLLLRAADAAATYSIVASIAQGLQESDLTPLLGSPENAWRALNDTEYAQMVKFLWERDRSVDGGINDKAGGCLLADCWGNRFQIAVRKTDEGGIEFRVWSSGPDGVSGTSDDIGIGFPRRSDTPEDWGTQ